MRLQVFRQITAYTKDLVRGEMLGVGSEASVYAGKWRGCDVAVKQFRGIPDRQALVKELAIMSLVRHPHLLRCFGGATRNEEMCMIVTELMHCDVEALVHGDKPYVWTPARVAHTVLQAARGLACLHAYALMHRDLKCSNLLANGLDARVPLVKVADFGLSRLVDRSTAMTGNVGTVTYIAPEIFGSQAYSEKGDVYSFAIVLWEIVHRATPFAKLAPFAIPNAVLAGTRPDVAPDTPKTLKKLILKCWDAKPSKRPAMKAIVRTLERYSHECDADEVKGGVEPTKRTLLGRRARTSSGASLVATSDPSSEESSEREHHGVSDVLVHPPRICLTC